MRNHWLKLHEQKQKRYWTAEFAKNGMFILRQRRVEIIDPKTSLQGPTGSVSLIFRGAGGNVNDTEFLSFISQSTRGMANWYTRLRHCEGLSDEIEFYVLSDLSLPAPKTFGLISTDVEFIFDYADKRHFC